MFAPKEDEFETVRQLELDYPTGNGRMVTYVVVRLEDSAGVRQGGTFRHLGADWRVAVCYKTTWKRCVK